MTWLPTFNAQPVELSFSIAISVDPASDAWIGQFNGIVYVMPGTYKVRANDSTSAPIILDTGQTEEVVLGAIKVLGPDSEDARFVYDRSDFMKPWALKTQPSERIDLQFTPFFERIAKTNLLIVKSEVRQVIGRFSGTVVPDDGVALHLEGMVGWVEWHEARW